MGQSYEEHIHFRAGRGGKPQRKQKRGDQSGWMEARREGTEAKEGVDVTKEGVLNNNLTLSRLSITAPCPLSKAIYR